MARNLLAYAAAIAALAPAVSATYGVDVSAPVSGSAASCMRSNGRDFAIVRAWQSFGAFDPNCPGSVKAFWDGGFAHVDVYLFPCYGQDPASQANSLVDHLSSNGVKYGMIWLDIETNPSPGCGSAEHFGVNGTGTHRYVQADGNLTAPLTACDFVATLKSTLRGRGVNVGTYASSYEWSVTVGSGCTSLSDTPIWYPHYDGEASFADWQDFAGFTKPAMKQYSGSGSLCGVGIDSNWYP